MLHDVNEETLPRTQLRPIAKAPTLAELYCAVRYATEALADPLSPEDQIVQSMPDASPTKWHLGHTSWFFERLVLAEAIPSYRPFRPELWFLFNSYYDAFGARLERDRRGLVTRPSVEEVQQFRRHVDANMLALLCGDEPFEPSLRDRIVIGLHHEQQHQELLLTDIKHAFASNPLRPSYLRSAPESDLLVSSQPARPLRWRAYPATITYIGAGSDGFAFDNERPRHQALVHQFELADRLTTNGEYLAFMTDGGYRRPELWLADGWRTARDGGWDAPLYWERRDGRWWHMTLAGMRPVSEAEPVCHLSYYEADAYARWTSARLPTEQEWEVAAAGAPLEGHFVETGVLQPLAVPENDDGIPLGAPRQLFGDVWEWTASPYLSYPGFRPWAGALGEYNAKFMINQMVLRGGSCATPRSHIRPTYRNYFPPQARWQFSGLRLARS